MRVVYDGAPGAGKTTNVRWLHEHLLRLREGTLASPDSPGRQTQFFDARDFPGGYLDGTPIRGQVLSVPGQTELRARRRHLLALADAVVFVASPLPEDHPESRARIRSLGALLLERRTPLVVQVNKLDLANTPLDGVADALRLDPDVPLLGARAHEGLGVADTFLTAMRLAVGRTRDALGTGSIESAPRAFAPSELLAELLALEGAAHESEATRPKDPAP